MKTVYLATLLATPRISRRTVYFLLKNFTCNINTITELRDLLVEGRGKNSRIYVPTITELESAYEKTIKNFELCEKQNIHIIDINNEKFPQSLREISNPPIILYYKGNIDILSTGDGIAVIGTRNPTMYGKKVSGRLGYLLGRIGNVVISGLAKGCDSAAHKGCLESKGNTVAVLAHGLDRIYPSSNKALAQDILNNNGCLISEYTLGTNPLAYNFVERDRIQSGLSKAVIVVETDESGGTMQTAKFCLEQNKLLGCYLHDVMYLSCPQTRGNQKLINQGKAMPLKDESQLQEFISKVYSNDDNRLGLGNDRRYTEKGEQLTFFNSL